MRIIPALALLVSGFFGAVAAHAHEFWISPEKYQVPEGAAIRAELRVGQFFKGPGYAYLPGSTERFELRQNGSVYPAGTRLGDRPALDGSVPGDGLVIVVHETSDSILTYTKWETFTGFVEHKAFDGALEAHTTRGLPETGFRESYRRFAKSLIGVGSAKGQDQDVGLETEIVARANPYTDDMSQGMPVQILYQGQPRPGAQLEVFDKTADGEVTVTRLRADAEGGVTVPVAPGHEYLLDAVVLRDTGNDDPEAGPVWRSLWASLTFRVPPAP